MFKKIKVGIIVPILMLVSVLLAGCFGGASAVKVQKLEVKKIARVAVQGIVVSVTLDKDLNLDDKSNNIEIAYFVVNNGKTTAIKNSAKNADLIKDKGWAGFLFNDGVKYVKGTQGADDYNETNSNLLKANVVYQTELRDGTASDNTSMEYHSIDWNENYTFKVVVTITTKEGSSKFSETLNYVGA